MRIGRFAPRRRAPWPLPAVALVHALAAAALLSPRPPAPPAGPVVTSRLVHVALPATPTEAPPPAPPAPPVHAPRAGAGWLPVPVVPPLAAPAPPAVAAALATAMPAATPDAAPPAPVIAATPPTAPAPVQAASPVLRVARADHRQCAPAPYPRALRERGIEGTVRLRVLVDAEGRAADVRLVAGSGWRLFDQQALQQAQGCRFFPATRDGQGVESWVEYPVRFTLAG
jgi:protein TonB